MYICGSLKLTRVEFCEKFDHHFYNCYIVAVIFVVVKLTFCNFRLIVVTDCKLTFANFRFVARTIVIIFVVVKVVIIEDSIFAEM